ncbi:phospholipase D-like domain-containing protein [Streptomyces geranii]|uniref:hypothetical protein n=1 Tax=Streptomyces geranii TaxID=2058923 RepID=UPI000D03664C|nr:hypothetical protein [Streptomyces geranii]
MSDITSVTVLTAADAANQLQSKGFDALGLTVPAFGTQWSTAGTTADDTTLRLSVTGPRAPFTGTFRLETSPVTLAAVTGDPISSPAGVLRLHPEAVHRLETLVRLRYGGLQRPVPVAMVVHGVTIPAGPQLVSWFRGGDDMGITGTHDVSFHDRRGLIIDPVAVAALLADLMLFRPALVAAGAGGSASLPGGISTIANLIGPAVRVHVVSPHGAAYRSRRPVAELEVIDQTGSFVRAVPASGIVDLATAERLGRATTHAVADAAAGAPLLWGLAPDGTLDTTPLAAPLLPTTGNPPSPTRQFFRVVAVDLGWHLLGNRGIASGDAAVPGETGRAAEAPVPAVRKSASNFDFLIDGNDILGAMGAISAALPPPGPDQRALLSSPVIETTVPLPPSAGALGHWPAFPPGPPPSAGDTAAIRRYDATGTALPTATWRTPASGPNRDVIVSFPAGSLPAGTHVRVYPRTFKQLRGINQDPSFVRGDGGAAIVPTTGDAELLLVNPFLLTPTDTGPDPTLITIDIVAVGRDGTRRLLSSTQIAVGAPQQFTDNLADFGGTTSASVAALLAVPGNTAIAPATAFGNPQVPAPPALPSLPASPTVDDVLAWVRTLANETTSPRIGPHLPTQERFDTILALGSVPTGQQIYAWDAVLSGARFGLESRCASPDLADPGNPAGPDAHITGVRVGGQLAYDLAFHALKRCLPIIPLGGPAGWIVQSAGANWDVPDPDPEPPSGQPFMAGAVLETIAPLIDSPELSFLPLPPTGASVSALVGQVAAALGAPAPVVAIANEARLLRELQGEIQTAKDGQRDAMWSIARAVAEAREYVLIESPMFGRTARPDGTHPEDGLVDLVTLLVTRLNENPRLKVMVCVPRFPDFPVEQENWFRAALVQRKTALELLVAADTNRVAAFHPIGFPGRTTVGRGTVVLVDDAYALVGTSHWRRRGMTFDGGCDLVSIDRRLDDAGSSAAIARFRQELLAARLGVPIPTGAPTTSALWTRLAEPESAFDAVRDLLQSGGQGRCTPVWAGPTDTAVIPETDDKTDPNGKLGVGLLSTLLGLVP